MQTLGNMLEAVQHLEFRSQFAAWVESRVECGHFVVGAELAAPSQQRRTTVHDTHSCSQHCLVLAHVSWAGAGVKRATVLVIEGQLVVGSSQVPGPYAAKLRCIGADFSFFVPRAKNELPLPPPSYPLSFLRSRPPKYSKGVWWSAVSSPSGVWV